MPEDIEEVEFSIFDTETTGLYPDAGDRIVELAALRVKGKQRLAVFDALINPGRPISPEAFAINKITPEMLKDAPAIEKVMPRFLEFIAGSCLCSYNAGFDLSFLNNELKLIGSPVINPSTTLRIDTESGVFFPRPKGRGLDAAECINNSVVFDVLAMAKRLMPALPRYALWFVAQKLGVESKQEHRALSDAEMTWEVFTRLKIICAQKGIAGFAEIFKLGTV